MNPIAEKLLHWYDQHARDLPWRNHPDPYAVWVSEIMLQQTRVETVIPYFQRWLITFPTLQSLAEADEQQVLSLWEGLGYYSRARNLHKAARIVTGQFGGQLPASAAELQKLPGIGRYTAAAIASMAFGQDIATLDGNLKRVFARLFNVAEPADSPPGEAVLWALSEQHLPPGRAGDYNQSLMDLGATTCLPKNPLCSLCPLGELCQARILGVQEQRPVMKPKVAVPHKFKIAAVIVERGKVLMAKRPETGLLAGLWEFPAGEVDADRPEAVTPALETGYRLGVRPLDRLAEVKHAYTHFRLTEWVYRCELIHLPENDVLAWVEVSRLEEYPMGKVDRAIARLVG